MKNAEVTKTQFLDVAKKLFAQKGFYGVSIASISGELGFTKQALLHHFGSKEGLYGAVLEGISRRFLEALEEGPDSLQGASPFRLPRYGKDSAQQHRHGCHRPQVHL